MAPLYRSVTNNLPDGYTFQSATLQDVSAVQQLLCQRQMTGSAALQVEALRREWQTSGFNPALDVRLIFDQRERLVGYIEVWCLPLPAQQPWLWGCVHPEHEGRGLGTALLSWAEARVRLAIGFLPALGRCAPRFVAPHSLARASALCANLGWLRAETTPQTATGALRLLLECDLRSVDVYEKEMPAGAPQTALAM